MFYIWQHIKTIIETYKGAVPLSHFLKHYFRANPKLGSRDRKILSEMSYAWYRCSKGISIDTFEDAVISCLSLCHVNPKIFAWLGKEKSAQVDFDIHKLLSFQPDLSEGITIDEWLQNMLTQPDLFIRIRKDEANTLSKFRQHDIPYTLITDTCVALPNGTKTDQLLQPDSYVVQDASSQQTGRFFDPSPGEQWYDCCSGAGGKSLLLKDLQPAVKLTVSDKRASIIHNLKERFHLYHHETPQSYVFDVADKQQLNNNLKSWLFDGIICDVPCSGSGTWARTPEQLFFFDSTAIPKFNQLQRTIAVNASRYLKPGKHLFYITCSVFKNENEDVVDYIISETDLQVVTMQLINGIAHKADSMFIAVLKKG